MSTQNDFVWNTQPLQQHQSNVEPVIADNTDTGGDNSGGSGQGSSDYSPSEFASGFLNEVADEDKAIVEKYLNKWDSGVTKKFQDLNDKLKPYEEYGLSPEVLPQVGELLDLLENDPKTLYELLAEVVNPDGVPVNNGGTPVGNQQQNLGSGANSTEGTFQVPPELLSRVDNQDSLIKAVAQIILGNEEQAKAQQEDQALDAHITELKTKYPGNFNEEYVLMKIANGGDGEEAIKEWQGMIQKELNSAGQKPTPPILSGTGGVVSGQQSVKDLSRADTKKLVAETLARVAQANQ